MTFRIRCLARDRRMAAMRLVSRWESSLKYARRRFERYPEERVTVLSLTDFATDDEVDWCLYKAFEWRVGDVDDKFWDVSEATVASHIARVVAEARSLARSGARVNDDLFDLLLWAKKRREELKK